MTFYAFGGGKEGSSFRVRGGGGAYQLFAGFPVNGNSAYSSETSFNRVSILFKGGKTAINMTTKTMRDG